MKPETRRSCIQYAVMMAISIVAAWFAVHRANILGREQLHRAVEESVSRTGKRLDAIEETLRRIEKWTVPQQQNTRLSNSLEVRR